MKTSLRSALLQRISSDAPQGDGPDRHRHRHRHRRPDLRGRPARGNAVRLTLIVVAAAILLAGAGYGVRQLTDTARQHPAANASAAHNSASPTPSASPPTRPPGQAGQYQVAEQAYTFTEPAGATLGTRILPVLVFYPQAGKSGAAR